ncbi:MAG: hypothetical protein C4308_00720 [Chitinophagaceae bacterium]
MPNKHYQKWLLQMPAGFLLTTAGIVLIMYAANKRASEEWMLWAVVTVAIINSGLAILGNAYIHKVKSDLMRRSRSKSGNSRQATDERD